MQSLSIDKTHWCFNHLGEENLQKLANIADIEIYGILSHCKSCILTKIVKTITVHQQLRQLTSWTYFIIIRLGLLYQ